MFKYNVKIVKATQASFEDQNPEVFKIYSFCRRCRNYVKWINIAIPHLTLTRGLKEDPPPLQIPKTKHEKVAWVTH